MRSFKTPVLSRPLVYQPLIPQILTACYHCILLPPRAFDAHPPVTRDVFYAVALFLQLRAQYPELVRQHRGAGSLLLTPRLDAQATFAKLFADIGREGDVRYAKLDDLLKGGLAAPISCQLPACPSPAGGSASGSTLPCCRAHFPLHHLDVRQVWVLWPT